VAFRGPAGPASLQEIGNLFKIQGEPVVLQRSILRRVTVAGPSVTSADPARANEPGENGRHLEDSKRPTDWDKTKSNQWCPLVGKVKSKEEVDVTVRKGQRAQENLLAQLHRQESSIDARAAEGNDRLFPQGCKAAA